MKTWFITLPLLCAVSVAMAQGVEKEGAADQPAAVAAPTEAQVREKAQAQDRAARPKAKPRQGGDVRHCLDLKTRTEIIRCSETRRKK